MGVRPNRLTYGEGHWNGVGGVGMQVGGRTGGCW